MKEYSMFMDMNTLILKVSVLPKYTYRFNTVQNQAPASYFVSVKKLILKFIWRDKRPKVAKTISKKNSQITDTNQFQELPQSYSNLARVILMKE